MDDCDHTWLYIGSKRQQAWRCVRCGDYRLYEPKQKREWVGLTYKERCELWNIASKFSPDSVIMHDFARDIEAALKEKNR
jgi:hypothetical protein